MTLSTLRSLAEAATPGPWTTHSRPVSHGVLGAEAVIMKDGETTTVIAETEHLCDGKPLAQLQADYRFIAACSPEVILALIAEVEESRRISKDFLDSSVKKQ